MSNYSESFNESEASSRSESTNQIANETKSTSSNSKPPKLLQRIRRESLNTQLNNVEKPKTIGSDVQTQTEWSWLQDMELLERIRKEGIELFGDIFRDIESDSDEENDIKSVRSNQKTPSITRTNPTIESVGPPKILQYQPESKQIEISPPTPSTISLESERIDDLGHFMQDFNVYINGGNNCEFCGNKTLPWPSISNQASTSPEELHCCNEYQEFVEGLFQYQIEKEKLHREDYVSKDDQIRNQKAKHLAKERAEYRKMQRAVERERQIEKQRQAQIKLQQQKQIQLEQHQQKQEKQQKKKQTREHHAGHEENAGAAAESDDEFEPTDSFNKTTGKGTDMSKQSNKEQISNQIRSINYQLSNLKYIQDGWTVRPESPFDLDDEMNVDEVELNLLARSSAIKSKVKHYERPLTVRNYKNGNVCMILFPNGTGSVYYPSGKIAISIALVSDGMHILSAFADTEFNAIQLGIFDPYGNGNINFPNGKTRMVLSPLGGIELETDGTRKRRWLWHEMEEHVHAPPLQPIILSLNHQIGIKIYNQEKIHVNFYAENQVCKFKVGSKIKIVRPESMPNNFMMDLSEYNLKKKRTRIEELIRLMCEETNVLKLPKINIASREVPWTPRLKLTLDSVRLPQDKYTNKKSNQKATTKFLTVP